MKHLETVITESANKVLADKSKMVQFQALIFSLSKLYPSYGVTAFAMKAIGNKDFTTVSERPKMPMRSQMAAQYDLTTYTDNQDGGCAGCKDGQTPVIVEEVTTGEVNSLIDTEHETVTAFIQTQDTKGFADFLKAKNLSIGKKDSKDMEFLIMVYENNKQRENA